MHFWDEHKTITRYYEMKMSGVCEKYNLRQMEYDILMFLYNNPEYNTAADIVRIRKSTKSIVEVRLKSGNIYITIMDYLHSLPSSFYLPESHPLSLVQP